MRFRRRISHAVPKSPRVGRSCRLFYRWTPLLLLTFIVILVNLLLYIYHPSLVSLTQLQNTISGQLNYSLNITPYLGGQSLVAWVPAQYETLQKFTQELVGGEASRRVVIWDPSGECNGSFTSVSAKHGDHGVPYAMVREAVIDRRVATDRHFVRNNPQLERTPSIRIVFYITAHLSVRLTSNNSTAAVFLADGTQGSYVLNVDYVLQTEPFLNQFNLATYKPGRLNQKRLALAEWQVSVSVKPNPPSDFTSRDELVNHLIQLSQSPQGALIRLSLALIRFDNVMIRFEPSMSLACITGWVVPSGYPINGRLNGEPSCSQGYEKADGAILFSGTFLYGSKNRNVRYYSEIAHFAARGLLGPVKFSTVVASVLPLYSMSDMSFKCKGDSICWNKLRQENRQHLEEIRDVVETEFIAMGVERASFQYVIIMPGCRLGSHASGTEQDAGPCSASYRYGQYLAKLYGYAMLSPFYKWAFSYDWDEVILAPPSGIEFKPSQGPAAELLDAADAGHKGYLTFGWLNFLASSASAHNLTADLIGGHNLTVKPKPGLEGQEVNCWDGRKTGKPAVRCDVGLGFTIHSSVVWESNRTGPSLVMRQVSRLVRSFHIFHPRLKSSSGKCAYVHV